MGWNSWCTDSLCNLLGKDPCTEKEVQTTVVAMVDNGLLDLGYNYIALDDCWSATTRDANGDLQADRTKFPNGMKAVADFVHEHDMKFGLYTSLGTETCKGKRPGSFNHYVDDAATLTQWGVDMIKMDHCGSKNGTDLQLYGEMSTALNQTGRPVLFSLCNWGLANVWEWGADIAQMYRVQMDHLPFWRLSENRSAGAGTGQGTYDIIEWMATLVPSKWTKAYGWMDPDFLMTGYWTMDYTASRTEYTFWWVFFGCLWIVVVGGRRCDCCFYYFGVVFEFLNSGLKLTMYMLFCRCLWSAPLLISTDLRHLSEDKRRIITNKEVIAINQDRSATAGDRIWVGAHGEQVWSRPLFNGDVCVVLYNSGRNGTESRVVGVEWGMIEGWSSSTVVGVRDVWEQKEMGKFTGGLNATLKVKDVMMLRLTKVE